AVALAHRFEERSIGPDLRMAIHAGSGGRNAGKAGDFDRGVTIAAINAQPRNVVLVAERHRLRPRYSRVGYIGRTLNIGGRPEQCRHHANGAIDGGPRYRVRTAMKNLHRMMPFTA